MEVADDEGVPFTEVRHIHEPPSEEEILDAKQTIALALERVEQAKRDANRAIQLVFMQLAREDRMAIWRKYMKSAQNVGEHHDWKSRPFDADVIPADFGGWIYGWPR